jgi:hypothetical protein
VGTHAADYGIRRAKVSFYGVHVEVARWQVTRERLWVQDDTLDRNCMISISAASFLGRRRLIQVPDTIRMVSTMHS